MATLGQTIGVVRHAFSITNDAGDKVQLTIGVDFTLASDTSIKSWLVSNRTIAGQRPWRGLSASEIRELDGQTIPADGVGKKVKSLEERKAEARAILAALKAAHPEEYAGIVSDVDRLGTEGQKDSMHSVVDNL